MIGLATQAGMVGGGALTVPLSLSPTIWLDSDDATTLYDAITGGSNVALAGNIKRWEDKSGNDYHALQPTAANCPTRETGGISFNGSTDWLEMDYSVSFTEITVFAVWKSATTNGRIIDQRGTGAPGTITGWQLKQSNPASDISSTDDGAGEYKNRRSYTASTTDYHMSRMRANASTLTVFVDGAEITDPNDSAGSVNFSTTKSIVLGANQNGKTTQLFNGFIREILVFSTVLSAGDISDMEDYLTAKYSL